MRCQYCGKRLPLFRKLKDGEFCSAAHRQQFLAQSDQLALAALQEQRERTFRAKREPQLAAAKTAPAPDSSFCDKYLVSSMAAVPLGQLACMPQEPAIANLPLFMPECAGHAGTPRGWSPTDKLGKSMPADQVLSALNDAGLGREALAPSLLPAMPGRLVEILGGSQLAIPGWVDSAEFRPLPNEAVLSESPSVCRPHVRPILPPSLALKVDPIDVVHPIEATAIAGLFSLSAPSPHSPTALMSVAATPTLVARCLVWLLRHPWTGPSLRLTLAGLEPLAAVPVGPPTMLAMAGAATVRFPGLVPTISWSRTRTYASLQVAHSSETGTTWTAYAPTGTKHEASATVQPIPVLTPDLLLERAREAVADRLGIAGQLVDLLEPTAMAPARRVSWRLEPQRISSICTLAIRHFSMDVAPVLPTRPTLPVGPRRAETQIRLNSFLRPVRSEFAAGADSVTFHLEPKVMQPRLRVQPDPARQGSPAAQSKGKNHADAAISSIKIPVLRRFWDHAPADIRWVALIIPLVFFLAWYSWTPNGKALNKQAEKADLAVDTSGVQTVLASFKSRISSRAAVELSEDFRAGLGEWQGSREDWAENWSYDQAGFVRPGNLAIFTPTVTLHDYNFEFLGQIENRALSWVYRAKDARNYYSGKLVIVRGGPVPDVAFVRTVVKNGREIQRKQIPLAMNLRADTIYRIRVDVNGSDFTTSVLGQVVDTFTDAVHPQGGVGFYGGHGETGRIRWVEVSHQYDTLGRLCAMLVPYGVTGTPAPVKTVGQ